MSSINKRFKVVANIIKSATFFKHLPAETVLSNSSFIPAHSCASFSDWKKALQVFRKIFQQDYLNNRFQSNKRNRGEVHLLMHLSTSDKSHQETLKDHRRLLRILLSFELIQRKCQPFEWKDNFSKETLQILAQHAVQVHKYSFTNEIYLRFLQMSVAREQKS